MDNINVVVLIVAIVFVAAGVTLIALSAVVGRGTPASPRAAEPVTGPTDEAAQDEDGVLFIDEPLTTDLAEQLAKPERGRRTGAVATEAPATDDVPVDASAPAPDEAPTDTRDEAAIRPTATTAAAGVAVAGLPAVEDERSAEPVEAVEPPSAVPVDQPVADTPAEPAAAVAVVGAATAGADPRKNDAYDFSVQLGFKYLDNKLFSEAAAEFKRAASLTDDSAVKLSLFTKVGDALREHGMRGPACASYLQATAYTDDPDVRARLERTIDDMTDTEPTTGYTSGSSRNGQE